MSKVVRRVMGKPLEDTAKMFPLEKGHKKSDVDFRDGVLVLRFIKKLNKLLDNHRSG